MDNILFIDDERSILHSLKLIFSKEGYRLFFAETAVKAKEILKNNIIAVVVSDNKLSETTGIELLKEVKKKSPYSVRVMLSGNCDIEDTKKSINIAQVYKFVSKPFNGISLKAIIRKSINKFHESKLIAELNNGNTNIIEAIQRFTLNRNENKIEFINSDQLLAGMTLREDLRSDLGLLLARKGHTLSLHDFKTLKKYQITNKICINKRALKVL